MTAPANSFGVRMVPMAFPGDGSAHGWFLNGEAVQSVTIVYIGPHTLPDGTRHVSDITINGETKRAYTDEPLTVARTQETARDNEPVCPHGQCTLAFGHRGACYDRIERNRGIDYQDPT